MHGLFLRSADEHPDRPALEVDGETFSYAQLRRRAATISAALVEHRGAEGSTLTGLLVGRSKAAYASILGILGSGHGYVPLLPSLPTARMQGILAKCECRTLVVDAAGAEVLDDLLEALSEPRLVLLVDLPGEREAELADRHDRHRFIGAAALAKAQAQVDDGWPLPAVSGDDLAYLLFTSGSTGEPKGVTVTHANITAFMAQALALYAPRPTDRFSHVFEFTFDLSIFDMFVCWGGGACLCVANPRQRLLPMNYITEAELTEFFCVPSAALLMKKMRGLEPNAYPNLRLVFFCGEALPVTLAAAFAEAAPNAELINVYGPTETTLVCTEYRWHEGTPQEAENGVVPIGEAYPNTTLQFVDEDLNEVAPGEAGELLIANDQITLGYWGEPERTAAVFFTPPGRERMFYRTGDRVRRPKQPDGPITFLGRMDSQIKIHGYRVELGEIEAVLRRVAGLDAAVALGWPQTESGAADGVVAFVAKPDLDVDAMLDAASEFLPKYMVPKRVELLERFPLNVNGKIDRRALLASLDDESQ